MNIEQDDDGDNRNETIRFVVNLDSDSQRVDKVLADMAQDLSRSRVQALINDGALLVNNLPCSDGARKVKFGSVLELSIPPLEEAMPEPENIPLFIVYEDTHLLVIDKPVGLVVHPGAGNWTGTLVNALLFHCAGELSGIGGVMRPGIVHRLDKDTSGLMVVAKDDQAHKGLSAQLADRSLSRIYEALVLGVPVPVKGCVDMPIGRDPRNRLKMSVNGRSGKEARTHYLVLESYRDAFSLVECKLESGRTHQIRVHMQALKHPLIGDSLYRAQDTAVRGAAKRAGYAEDIAQNLIDFPRQALHAKAISFIHPVSEKRMEFESVRPDDISNVLKLL